MEDLLEPARTSGFGVHPKNVYNDYVYFWRLALWKVFDTTKGPGILSFFTSASYLRGPGFVGVRQEMRKTFDALWIIDLEGDNRGPRKRRTCSTSRRQSQLASACATAVRDRKTPARVHYTRVTGD